MESSSSAQSKPVVVRVKRRLCQPPLDALWLEINDRPLKQACLDFSKLAVSETSQTDVSDKVPTKILVQHIDTVDDAEAAKEAVQSFIGSSSEARNNSRKRLVEERNSMKQCKSLQDQLRSTSRQKHDEALKNTRFQQLWKSRNRNDEDSDSDFFQELCRLYDVVRVDETIEESSSVPHENGNGSLDGYEDILCNFLPLIREHIPEAVAEIESDISASKRSGDGYVYDLYTMANEMPTIVGDAFDTYPLVLLAEDDFYDGPEKNEYDSPDSNDEDNPLNDYPDEDDLSSSENEESHSGSSQETDNESNLYEKYMDEDED